ncbi:CG14464 [Drosophila busckii]|uniref:CG14464 n=1 Tax=Drosophila busckii TaxID=30019 RepID=A0A0M4E664_DROBS|nr:ARL14 effector protein [Drosophila busckii]ALC39771.1 CG14464 [Drosophila busckii]
MSSRSLRQRPQRKTDESVDDGMVDTEKTKCKKGRKKSLWGHKSCPYDEYGNIRHNGLDVCDCMNDKCDGCWYPCRICGSTRCGPQCRASRKFYYESIQYDGKELVITNPQIPYLKN